MLVIPIFIYMTSMGMIITSSFTLAMKNQGHRAGSASAVIGMLPLVLGSAVSPLVSIDETTAVPMGAILFITSFIGFVFFFKLILLQLQSYLAVQQLPSHGVQQTPKSGK